MTEKKNDPYEKLFISDKEAILTKAKRRLSNELCKCGHTYREHDNKIGGCKELAPNRRNICECLEFRGKSLMDCVIEIVLENKKSQEKIFKSEITALENKNKKLSEQNKELLKKIKSIKELIK